MWVFTPNIDRCPTPSGPGPLGRAAGRAAGPLGQKGMVFFGGQWGFHWVPTISCLTPAPKSSCTQLYTWLSLHGWIEKEALRFALWLLISKASSNSAQNARPHLTPCEVGERRPSTAHHVPLVISWEVWWRWNDWNDQSKWSKTRTVEPDIYVYPRLPTTIKFIGCIPNQLRILHYKTRSTILSMVFDLHGI